MTTHDSYEEAARALRDKDFDNAFSRYRDLAANGQQDCFGILGWLYFAGKGTPQDLKAARLWLTRSAEGGDPQGQFYLAKLCWSESDGECVIRWLTEAARLGYAPAFFRLGRVFEDGVLVKRDFQKAISYYREASDRQHLVAENRYALLLLLGKAGVRMMPVGAWLYARSAVRMVREAYRDPDSDSLRV